ELGDFGPPSCGGQECLLRDVLGVGADVAVDRGDRPAELCLVELRERSVLTGCVVRMCRDAPKFHVTNSSPRVSPLVKVQFHTEGLDRNTGQPQRPCRRKPAALRVAAAVAAAALAVIVATVAALPAAAADPKSGASPAVATSPVGTQPVASGRIAFGRA